MDEFTIPGENINTVVIELLADITTQNRMIAEMLLPTYCQAKGITQDEARAGLNDFFHQQRSQRMHQVFADHGTVSINDIVGTNASR